MEPALWEWDQWGEEAEVQCPATAGHSEALEEVGAWRTRSRHDDPK